MLTILYTYALNPKYKLNETNLFAILLIPPLALSVVLILMKEEYAGFSDVS